MFNKTCLIIATCATTFAELKDTLYDYSFQGYKYFFIDSITEITDFIPNCAILSDQFVRDKNRIVIAGPDSLSFYLAADGRLHDKIILENTSYISYYEFCKLLGSHNINDYIDYGGPLVELVEKEMTGEPNFIQSPYAYASSESVYGFLYASVILNIARSISNDKLGASKSSTLVPLLNDKKMISLINLAVLYINSQHTLSNFRRGSFLRLPKANDFFRCILPLSLSKKSIFTLDDIPVICNKPQQVWWEKAKRFSCKS